MDDVVEQVESGVATVRAGLDLLLAVDVGLAGPGVALAALRELEVQQRRLVVVGHALIAEIGRQHGGSDPAAATAAVLVSELRLSPAEARGRVHAARDLGPRQTLTGQALAPIFEPTAAAQRAGLISAAHTREIVAAIDRLPEAVAAEVGVTVEQILVDTAVTTDPGLLRRFAHDLLTRLDPDGTQPNDEQQRRQRGLWLSVRRDGSADLSARLTAAATAVWTTLLDALSAPQPAQDDQPDPRTATQRRHDALLDLGQRLLRCGELPDAGGVPVTILATLTTNQLPRPATRTPATRTPATRTPATRTPATRTPATSPKTGPPHARPDHARPDHARPDHARPDHARPDHARPDHARPDHARPDHAGPDHAGPAHAGHARTAHGDALSVTQLLELADEAHLVTVALDPDGAITTIGQARRLATPMQRLALAARDHGCSFPGCTRPPAWCQTHHVIAWTNGGPTTLANLTLVCGHHHREFTRQGWSCQMTNGHPEWTPPPWIDPEQQPRHNTAHHHDPLEDYEPALLPALLTGEVETPDRRSAARPPELVGHA